MSHITFKVSIAKSPAKVFYSMAQSLEKTIIEPGNGTNKPKKGDTVSMQYTGWLYDPAAPQKRGKEYVLLNP